MITTQDLEMIPPIRGREKTFAWFPPAHNQYERVPYKSMAVLDDFKYFSKSDASHNTIVKHVIENEGTVLSSKLNAIRQELSKRCIVPSVIREQCLIKPKNIQEYMHIPLTWKPTYPTANVEILTAEIQPAIVKEIIPSAKVVDTVKLSDVRHDQEHSAHIKARQPLRRPYTAPGNTIRIHNSEKSAAPGNRVQSSRTVSRDERPSALMQHRLRRTSLSESNLSNPRYDTDLDKYKWLMEIPGDPFEIKKPHLPEKQQYFHSVEEIKILPQEPSMQKQNRDTFFYNSMPVQTFSFDISPNFMSEKYNRMKNHLRSQGKWNYSSKNFSFVY